MLKEHQDDKKKHPDEKTSGCQLLITIQLNVILNLFQDLFFSTQIYLITKSFGATVNKLRTASLMRFAIYELFIVYK